jgi:hypothetical protein
MLTVGVVNFHKAERFQVGEVLQQCPLGAYAAQLHERRFRNRQTADGDDGAARPLIKEVVKLFRFSDEMTTWYYITDN